MTNEELWRTVLSDLELQISRPNFLTWLKNSRLIEKTDGVSLIALPNNFAKEWVELKYHKLILGCIRNLDGSVRKIEYIVEGNLVKKPHRRPALLSRAPVGGQLTLEVLRVDPTTNLNPRYTLNSFIVGSFNELAHSAISAVIEKVGVKYNPVFVYGGVGLGKTHLLQGAGNEIKNLYKDAVRVRYVTSEKFTSDVVWAIRNRRVEDVKRTYRDVDVLIIDDIQFIGGKEKTEEEFFHTFNALHENNKQIIISSDRPPKAIPTLEERLRSRFEGGMIVDISYPDYETRLAIINTKLQERMAVLEDRIVDLIAKKVQRNIREIEGILNKLIFYQSTYKRALDLNMAEKIITEIVDQSATKTTPSQIIKSVAGFFEISPNDLVGRARNKEFVEPRQITMYLFREMLNMSYPDIANKVGKRDHTTAIYAYKKICEAAARNSDLSQKLLLIKETVNKPG
ncbi:MAG: chromosomal replication initiator protein DnaA [Candidatus Colwellbacteria bacterium]|nr:chromosomal replication initiator protein DnaA [Candidatus Colwellbacteria bacterium]MBI3088901.1 chromosomal replication initiator protein DnaA [Candidatus Colwellbacteria bacterium]